MCGVSEQIFHICADLTGKWTVVVVYGNAQFSKSVEGFLIDIAGSRKDALLIHDE